MSNGHVVHFISSDGSLESATSKDLVQNNLVNVQSLKNENLKVGEVFVFSHNNRFIFHVIVKARFEDRTCLIVIYVGLLALRKSMEPLEVQTIKVSKTGNNLDEISWR